MKRLMLVGSVLTAILVLLSIYISVSQEEYPTATPTPQPTATQTVKPPERTDLLNSINQERVKVGVKKLKLGDGVTKSAQMKANDFVKRDYFSHKVKGTDQVLTPEMSVHAYRDCTFVSENIFWGKTQTPLYWWNNSPPHRAAMIDPRYEYIGIGISDWRVVTHFCDID